MKGQFIVVEGLEGAGKTTAMEVIQEVLIRHGIAFLTTREPGGTPVGEVIRNLVKSPPGALALDPRTELLLMYASRIQLVEEVIRPALDAGTWVIADRFELSTRAYQGGGRGMDGAFIDAISAFALEGLSPDLLLYLDICPAAGLARALARSKADRIEQESLEFFERVHKAYQDGIRGFKAAVTVDAAKPLKSVRHSIEQILEHHLEHHARHAASS